MRGHPIAAKPIATAYLYATAALPDYHPPPTFHRTRKAQMALQETAEYTASIVATAPTGISIVFLAPDPSQPGQKVQISASSPTSAAAARLLLRDFLQSLRDAVNP